MTRGTSFAEPGVLVRLDEFRSLRDGCLEGRGHAPSRAGLDWLSNVFDHRYPNDLSPPYLYPTAEEGIQAEWIFGPWEITLEIDPDSHDGCWRALNLETHELSVTIADCATHRLPVEPDPEPLWERAVIRFDGLSPNEVRKRANVEAECNLGRRQASDRDRRSHLCLHKSMGQPNTSGNRPAESGFSRYGT
jgi:hypothetical protein